MNASAWRISVSSNSRNTRMVTNAMKTSIVCPICTVAYCSAVAFKPDNRHHYVYVVYSRRSVTLLAMALLTYRSFTAYNTSVVWQKLKPWPQVRTSTVRVRMRVTYMKLIWSRIAAVTYLWAAVQERSRDLRTKDEVPQAPRTRRRWHRVVCGMGRAFPFPAD